jgi:hypothetical protein
VAVKLPLYFHVPTGIASCARRAPGQQVARATRLKLGNALISRSFAVVMETWRDLFLAPGGARGDVSPPPVARALNSLFALLMLIGIVWVCLATLHLDWGGVWN